MFAFLPSLPGFSKWGDDVRALASRVDTARHHGVPNGCVLEFSLRSVPPETTGFDPLAIITGGGRPMALRDAVAAIHRAAEDARVAGLIARVQLAAAPPAAVQELREAIAAFSAVKPSLAWAEIYPGTLSYYLASAFGEVWMQPSGSVGLVGFASNATFLRDALDKAGIEAEFVARGEYKSAINRFTEDGFTDAHREAVTRMLESLQEQVWQAVAESRNLDSGALDALADRAPLLRDDAVASGLLDRIGFRDEAYARIAELIGIEGISPESIDSDENAPPRLYLSRYAGAAQSRLTPPLPPIPGRRSKPTLALVTVAGQIVNGRGGPQFLPFGTPAVGGDTIAAALREAAADDAVSAIVLRVDSPGGSLSASETIWREVTRARERGKPVVASMGSVAASGGYYISMGADAIVANPGTITGSIGVYQRKVRHSRSEGPVRGGVGCRAHQRQCRCLVDRRAVHAAAARPSRGRGGLGLRRLRGAGGRGPKSDCRSRGCRCPRTGLDRCRRLGARPGRRTRRASNRRASSQNPGRPGRGHRSPHRQLSGFLAAGHRATSCVIATGRGLAAGRAGRTARSLRSPGSSRMSGRR